MVVGVQGWGWVGGISSGSTVEREQDPACQLAPAPTPGYEAMTPPLEREADTWE